jgi:hypothetical protein
MHTQSLIFTFVGLHRASHAPGCIHDHEHSHEYAVTFDFAAPADRLDFIDGGVLTNDECERIRRDFVRALHSKPGDAVDLDALFTGSDRPAAVTPSVLAAIVFAWARLVITPDLIASVTVMQGTHALAWHRATFAAPWPDPVPVWAAEEAASLVQAHGTQVAEPRAATDLVKHKHDVPRATPDVVRDLLLIAGDHDVPLDVISGWTQVERDAVAAWAAAVHVGASDHDDVQVPPMPAVLRVHIEAPASPFAVRSLDR